MMAFLLFRPEPRDVLMVGWAPARWRGFVAPRAHARHARHGGRDQPGRGDRGAENTSAFLRRRPPANRHRRRSRSGSEAPGELRPLVVDGFVTAGWRPRCARSPSTTPPFSRCAPRGVLVANFMADDARLERHCARIQKAFGRSPVLLLARSRTPHRFRRARRVPRASPWKALEARARGSPRAPRAAPRGLPRSAQERNPGTARTWSSRCLPTIHRSRSVRRSALAGDAPPSSSASSSCWHFGTPSIVAGAGRARAVRLGVGRGCAFR